MHGWITTTTPLNFKVSLANVRLSTTLLKATNQYGFKNPFFHFARIFLTCDSTIHFREWSILRHPSSFYFLPFFIHISRTPLLFIIFSSFDSQFYVSEMNAWCTALHIYAHIQPQVYCLCGPHWFLPYIQSERGTNAYATTIIISSTSIRLLRLSICRVY